MEHKSVLVLSVNVGQNKAIQWKGRKINTSIFKFPHKGSLLVHRFGIEGDFQSDKKYHGGLERAVYGLDVKYYDDWQDDVISSELYHGGFGENLTLSGLLDEEAMIGDIYGNESLALRVCGPRMPCYKLNLRYRKMHVLKKFSDLRMFGVYFAVERESTISEGCTLHLLERKQDILSVKDIGLLLGKHLKDQGMIKMALELEYLPQTYKKSLIKLMDL